MHRITILLIACLLSLKLFAVQNKFEYITAENGLSQGNIECIFQDSKGFIWFGTFNGLNRYDGYDIVVYQHETNNPQSLSHEHIKAMCEDSDGKLWIATYGNGVSVLNPETNLFTRIEYTIIENDTILFKQLSAIDIDLDGNIWFIEENAGVFVYNPDFELIKYFRPEPENPKGLPASNYFGIAFDRDGTAWLGIGNGILGKIMNHSDVVEVFHFENRLTSADDGVKSIYVDKYNKVWIGTTSQGAYKYDPMTGMFDNYRKESTDFHISGNTILAFAEDFDDNLLFGIDGTGIDILNQSSGALNTISYDLGNPYSINTNAIYALYFDRSGNFWVGTYAGGINFQSKYKTKFKNFTPNPLSNNSLSYKNVTAFLQDNDGEIWIGTDGGGLNKFDMATDSFTHFRANPDNLDWLQTDVIIHLMQDSEGDIYISSYNKGLTIFNKYDLSWKQYLPDDSDPTSLAGIHPWCTFEDSFGEIWIGMLAVGLDKFDKENQIFSHYASVDNDPTTLNSPNIKIMYEDMNLDLWIGTEGGGLHKYNREEDNFTRYYYDAKNNNSLSNNDVRAIYEDMNMRFWIGTSNGLCLMDRDSAIFKTITVEDGLSGNTINGILEDDYGNLWITTDAGISKFNPDSMSFKNYDKTDGLQGNEYNYTASMISNNGYFFFGGKNGFNMFFPSEIEDNPHRPPVVITEIQILNKPYKNIKVKKKGKFINTSVSTLSELKLSHRENVLTFEFTALDFGNSGKNLYKYMMEGFDKEWTLTDASKRYATYTNLKGGDYVFRVIASNGDGVWNEEGVSIEITITPPFWKRKWFIGLVLILIIWLVVRFIRRRESQLQEDKEKLEKKIQEGLEEVNKQKDEVAQKDIELQEKLESEKEQNWYNVGMGRMSAVMSQNKDDFKQLSQSIITEIVEYIEVSQGVIYLVNDDKEDDVFLELMAAYAPDDDRLAGSRVEMGEGQVGTCYKEGAVVKVDNLPPEYASFGSGLGDAAMGHLVVIPLKLNEIVIGVVELLSFEALADYRITFVEKSGETLTSILTALTANEKTKKLLEQQKMQAEELYAQEEELRQNLEEMQATQEELTRMKESERIAEDERRESEKEFMEQLQIQNDELQNQQEALKKEEYLFNALLDNANEHIYFKDEKSKFIRLSNSMLKLFKVKRMDELIGKSDFDFFDDEHAQPAFDDEQKIIQTGKALTDKVEKESHKDGSVSWVSTTKMPLKDDKGKVVGTWGISKDISATKKMEEDVVSLKDSAAVCQTVFNQAINALSGKVTVFDEKAKLFSANHSFTKALKSKNKDVSGKNIYELISEEEAKLLKDNFKIAKKKGKASWTVQEGDNTLSYKLIRIFIEELKSNYYMLLSQ